MPSSASVYFKRPRREAGLCASTLTPWTISRLSTSGATGQQPSGRSSTGVWPGYCSGSVTAGLAGNSLDRPGVVDSSAGSPPHPVAGDVRDPFIVLGLEIVEVGERSQRQEARSSDVPHFVSG